MSHVGPLKWWTPRRRMVLFFDRACIEKSTRKLMRSGEYRVTFDTAFSLVIRECAALRPGKPPLTWITPRIIRLFEQAHAHGHAHSVEVWRDGQLVGGAYGLAVGDVFYTESQFHTARNASKLGFAVLNRHLQKWGFAFNDGKHVSRFLAGCGMLPVTRHEFSELAHCFGAKPRAPGRWTVEDDLCTGDWQPGQAQGLRMAGVMPQGTQCPETIDELLTTKRSPTW